MEGRRYPPLFHLHPSMRQVARMACCSGIGSRRGRRRRSCPRHIGEVEKFQQVRLHGITIRQMGRRANEAALDEFDDRSVIHRCMRDVVLARKRRNDQVWQPEPKLRGEAMLPYDVAGTCTGPARR